MRRKSKAMEKFISFFKLVFASMGGVIGAALGGVDGFLYALIVFVVIDYLTGVMIAFLNKKLSSAIGFRGIFKKIIIFAFIAIGYIIDQKIIGEGGVIRTTVIFFYLSNEGISILENAAVIGLPIPKKLRDVLEQLKEDKDNAGK